MCSPHRLKLPKENSSDSAVVTASIPEASQQASIQHTFPNVGLAALAGCLSLEPTKLNETEELILQRLLTRKLAADAINPGVAKVGRKLVIVAPIPRKGSGDASRWTLSRRDDQILNYVDVISNTSSTSSSGSFESTKANSKAQLTHFLKSKHAHALGVEIGIIKEQFRMSAEETLSMQAATNLSTNTTRAVQMHINRLAGHTVLSPSKPCQEARVKLRTAILSGTNVIVDDDGKEREVSYVVVEDPVKETIKLLKYYQAVGLIAWQPGIDMGKGLSYLSTRAEKIQPLWCLACKSWKVTLLQTR